MNIILSIQAFKYRLKSWESWRNIAGRFPTWFLCEKKLPALIGKLFFCQANSTRDQICVWVSDFLLQVYDFQINLVACKTYLCIDPDWNYMKNVKSRTLNWVIQVDFVVWCPHRTHYMLNLKERTSRAFHITCISLVVQPTNPPPLHSLKETSRDMRKLVVDYTWNLLVNDRSVGTFVNTQI